MRPHTRISGTWNGDRKQPGQRFWAELLFAAGLPILVVGIGAFAGWTWSFGPGPFASRGLAMAVVVVAILAVVALFFLTGFHYKNPVLFLSAIVMYGAAGAVGFGMEYVALSHSGESDVCVIDDVDTVVATSDTFEDLRVATTYEHEVTCSTAPVDLVGDQIRNGSVGAEITILYDPSGVAPPHSIDEVERQNQFTALWLVGTAALILLRVGFIVASFWSARRRPPHPHAGSGDRSAGVSFDV